MSSLPTTAGVIERYLRSLVEHDWALLEECLADDFTRVGPYIDVYPSKTAYIAFISDLMPRLPNYEMDVTRVTYADRVAFAELSETMDFEGGRRRTPECLTFDLDDDGRITRVEVFIQRQG